MVDGIAALELLVVFAEVLRSVVLDRALDNGHVGVEEVPLPLPIVEVRRGEGLRLRYHWESKRPVLP